MALTGSSAAKSSLYIRQKNTDSSRSSLANEELGAKKRVVCIDHTVVAGDGSGSTIVTADEMNLVELPAGCTLDLKESYVKFSASQGTNTFMLLGVRAWTTRDGLAVAEDADCIANNIDGGSTSRQSMADLTAGSAVTNAASISALRTLKFNSRGPITIFQKASDGTGTFDGDVGDIYSYQFTYWVD